MNDRALREHLRRSLAWEDAHVTLERAVEGMPAELRGVRPSSFPHSAWELLEHIRITQADILEFCRNSEYEEPDWPAEYWPEAPVPSPASAWDEALERILRDREALQELAIDPKVDLSARIPHGSGQTYLRELLLVVDHSAYHVGQIIAVRRLLGAWDR